MKPHILAYMKHQLHTIANQLSYENYQEMEGQVARIFTVLESVDTMMDADDAAIDTLLSTLQPKEVNKEETASPGEQEDTPEESVDEGDVPLEELLKESEAEEETAAPDGPPYKFERRLRGGFLPRLDAFVPERAVRELDLRDGDLLNAKFVSHPPNKPIHYDFELVERSDNDDTVRDLHEINMGIVNQTNDGSFVIERTVTDDVLFFEGEPIIYTISDHDATSFNLKDGDVVNAAHYTDSPQDIRIRWRHPLDTMTVSTPKSASHYKKKNTTPNEKPEPIFEGKTICALGNAPFHSNYRDEVESRGGTFLGLAGDETEIRMTSALSKCDALIMFQQHINHASTIFCSTEAKSQGVPFKGTDSFGRTTFVDTAKKLLEIEE